MGSTNHKFVTQEDVDAAVKVIRAWHAEPKVDYACPRCDVVGVSIIDRSARPHADWYAFKCEACGLDDAINIPVTAHSTRIV